MRTVVLVARRSDNGIRDAIWNHLRPIWEALGYEVHEGHHNTGPFNRSRAQNRAARNADQHGPWDIAIILDADIWIDPERLPWMINQAHTTGRLTFGHTAWWGTTPATRQAILDGRLHLEDYRHWPDDAWQIRNPLSNSCAMAVTRDLWDRIGGWDERFIGWGAEDWAWHVSCEELAGPAIRHPDPVIHLHHPISDEARAAHKGERHPLHDANVRLGKRYLAARGQPRLLARLHREARQAREA